MFVDTKTCSKCGETKTLDSMVKSKKSPSGRLNICKMCRATTEREKRNNNLTYGENQRKASRDYYYKNKNLFLKKQRNFRKSNPDYDKIRGQNPSEAVKRRARKLLASAIESGKIINPKSCAICKFPDSQGHHEDYLKPLEVIWMCVPCHRARHREIDLAERALHLSSGS